MKIRDKKKISVDTLDGSKNRKIVKLQDMPKSIRSSILARGTITDVDWVSKTDQQNEIFRVMVYYSMGEYI